MKKNFYYLSALALPLLFTACADDGLFDTTQNSDVYANAKVVNLDKDFRLFASRENNSPATRGEWVSGAGNGTQFYWMPKKVVVKDAGAGLTPGAQTPDLSTQGFTLYTADLVKATADDFDQVGLCWVGSDGIPAEKIYTNYQFSHSGWLAWGETERTKEPVSCVNGIYKYNWNFVEYEKAKAKDLTVTMDSKMVKGTLSAAIDAYDTGATTTKTITYLNLGKGTFKTENKSIFAGKYIAYYPYNKDLKKEDALLAQGATTMNFEVGEKNRLISAGDYTFACGFMDKAIEGGLDASSLKMDQVSGLLALDVKFAGQAINTDYNASVNVQKMILLDQKGGFISAVNLTATGIAEATAAADKAAAFKRAMKPGTAVHEQMVTVNFQSAGGVPTNLLFDHSNGATEINSARIIVPLLPTANIEAVQVLLINDKQQGALATLQNQTVESGAVIAGKYQPLTFDASQFMYIATDQPSLESAMQNAGATDKILLLGDVEINSAIEIDNNKITGEYNNIKVGRLIVKAADTSQTVLTVKGGSEIACDILVEAKGCCKAHAGKLVLENMTYLKGTAKEGEAKTRAIGDAAPNTITNNGEVVFGASNSTVLQAAAIYGNIVNQPLRFENGLKDFKGEEYLLAFETEAATIAIEKKTTVNLFGNIDNNYAKAINGNRVDATIDIAMKAAADADGNDGRLLVVKDNKGTGSLINRATIKNQGTIGNDVASANIKNEVLATFVNMIGGQVNGWKMIKEANSNYISEVDNSVDSRFKTALDDHLTNIIRIMPKNSAYANASAYPDAMTFAMEGINNSDLKFIINTEGVILTGREYVSGSPIAVNATIGGLEVTSKATNFLLNPASNSGATRFDPVSLTINPTTYNTKHVLDANIPVNQDYLTDIAAIKVLKTGKMTVNTIKNLAGAGQVKLIITGLFDITNGGTAEIGSTDNAPVLEQVGDIKVAGTFKYAEKVIKGKVNGQIEVLAGGKATFENDSKIKFYDTTTTAITGKGQVVNAGTCSIVTATSTKSPAVVYCNDFKLKDAGVWTNGRPTPFTAAGIQEGDYNW